MKDLRRGAHGDEVKALQRGIARTLRAWDLKWRAPSDDGSLGPATIRAALMASFVMGMSADARAQIRKGLFTAYAQEVLRHKRRRTPAMIARSLGRRPKIRRLRARHLHSGAELGFWDGRQVAGWMVGTRPGPTGQARNWLADIRATGHWAGHLYSGYRTPEESEAACYAICGAPFCSGLCAGRSSNHSQTGPPLWGAIDVVDPEGFQRGADQIGAPFKNTLPRDPNHRSYTGN